jgi:uncharacterized protein YcaQ
MIKINKDKAKNIWIRSQKLDQKAPFGKGLQAVSKAISHLGYVQIDTISVIERAHHHILYNRIPDYQQKHLHLAQSEEKVIFEYWTHALSYLPIEAYKYFISKMNTYDNSDDGWFSSVTEADYKKVKSLLKNDGPISIRDIKDDLLVEKTHAWGSAKPSKRALQLGFFKGDFVISERDGMLKKYDLTGRHFNWKTKPKMATETEYCNYLLERSLKSQGIISTDSVCYLEPKMKPSIAQLIENKLKSAELLEIQIDKIEKIRFFIKPETLDQKNSRSARTHILSPFDPLIIQRKKLKTVFDYEHLFEAYIPKEKRKFGYFSLPVLHENNIIALLDLKTDRIKNELMIQNWTWLNKNKSSGNKLAIENELDRFEKFQLKTN